MVKQIGRETLDDIAASAGLTVEEAGRRGGQSTLEHQGVEFFRTIGRKGGRRTKELYGELLSEFGRKGGRPRRPALNESLGEKDQ